MCQSAVNVDANLSLILGSVHSKQTKTHRQSDRERQRGFNGYGGERKYKEEKERYK